MSGDVEALAEEHVIDRDGLVWRLVHDGGMATRADYAGIVSIGINTLEREHGPLVTLSAHVAAARAEEREQWAEEVRAFSALLDSTYPPNLDAEAHRWRRVAKLTEEAGEVVEALLGCVAENPRKGASHSIEDVYKELLDVAFCALAACAHLNGNKGDVISDLSAHTTATHERLRRALLPATESREGDPR